MKEKCKRFFSFIWELVKSVGRFWFCGTIPKGAAWIVGLWIAAGLFSIARGNFNRQLKAEVSARQEVEIALDSAVADAYRKGYDEGKSSQDERIARYEQYKEFSDAESIYDDGYEDGYSDGWDDSEIENGSYQEGFREGLSEGYRRAEEEQEEIQDRWRDDIW